VRADFGDFVFDSDARQLTRGGEAVHLTPKAFDLLALLIEQRPRAVRKSELQDRLWPDVVVEEANLKNLVAEVRAAIGAKAIRTVQRFGYAFGAPEEARVAARLIHADRVHHLERGENIIGRDDDCDVVLDFSGVSRRHAVIRVAGSATLEDLGSKNGTWRNGERVSLPVPLQDGDELRIGALALIFRAALRDVTTATVA
jgi:DNA-binding winged helix-turn-helix (wHTH) protein